jgi:hypothetical protein
MLITEPGEPFTRGHWATDPVVVRTSGVDYIRGGAIGGPPEASRLASGTGPGSHEALALASGQVDEEILRQAAAGEG